MGVRTGAAPVADCGCAAARRAYRREPRIWSDVGDARTVDWNDVPVWDGAERRAGRLGRVRWAHHPAAAAASAIFLCHVFIGEEGDADADPEREW